MLNEDAFHQTLVLIDAANAQDPNTTLHQGQWVPNELLYAQRMTDRLNAFAPNASLPLQLAARAQHIERWTNPRSAFPEGRTGYKQWRAERMLHHAARAGELMAQAGCPQNAIDRTRYLIQKRALGRDAESQCLEDVICLVFIEHYLHAFAAGYDEAKLIGIIQKTWAKMSPEGQQAALALPLTPDVARVVGLALQG